MGTRTPAPPVAGPRAPVMSRDLGVLSTSFLLIFMGAGAFQQYLIRYLQEVTGRTPTECSWVLATVYLSFLVWRLFAAHTIRWLGDQRAIFLGQLTYTLFLVFAITAQSYWVLLAAASLWGWGASAMWIASSTQVLDASARTRYGSASGVFYAATHLGQWVGVVLLGYLLARHGWSALLWVAVGVSVAANAVALAVPRKYVARERPRMSKVFGVLRTRLSKLLAAILFVSSFGFGLLLSGFSTLLEPGALVWVTSGFYGGRLVSSWYSGWISDQLGRRGVLVWGFGLAAAGMLVGLKTDNLWALFTAALALGVQTGTVPVAAMAMIGDAVDSRQRHLAFGAIYVWRDLGVAVAILGAQYIVRFLGGYGICFALFALLFAACAVLASSLRGQEVGASPQTA
ncbi:MAG: MFS transporter [Armatimonadetes bacterium]|nr:MFS transporter [Armatimonadota bacterium]